MLEEAVVERSDDRKKSPSWLKPVVMMPSEDFEAIIKAVDPSLHQAFAEVIFSNCRAACFVFYRAQGLWRARYNSYDDNYARKLFQLDRGGFPMAAGDLTLGEWLSKIKRAAARINEIDTFRASDLFDYVETEHGITSDIFKSMSRICSLVVYSGGLDIENFEECLLLSLQLCRHIQGWESFGRLKVLWEVLHRPREEVEETGITIDLDSLMPPT
jgi:hypothetical protein